jgi:hypothetical protein
LANGSRLSAQSQRAKDALEHRPIVGIPLIMAGVAIVNSFFKLVSYKVCGAHHAHVWRGVSGR